MTVISKTTRNEYVERCACSSVRLQLPFDNIIKAKLTFICFYKNGNFYFQSLVPLKKLLWPG